MCRRSLFPTRSRLPGRPGEEGMVPVADVGADPARAVRRSCSWSSCCIPVGLRALARAPSGELRASCSTTRSSFARSLNTRRVPGRSRSTSRWWSRCSCRASSSQARTWIKWLSLLFILPWAVPSIPTILSIRFMLNPEWGIINSLIFRFTGRRRPQLAQRSDARALASRCWCTSGSRCRSGR